MRFQPQQADLDVLPGWFKCLKSSKRESSNVQALFRALHAVCLCLIGQSKSHVQVLYQGGRAQPKVVP